MICLVIVVVVANIIAAVTAAASTTTAVVTIAPQCVCSNELVKREDGTWNVLHNEIKSIFSYIFY